MLDPLPSLPAPLASLAAPIASFFNLRTLPLHIHEVILVGLMYHVVNVAVSPVLSRWLFPNTYPKFNRRTKIGWDVHVVSLFQSVLVCSLALWVMWTDTERAAMDWRGRVWGYTGATGMIQAFAAGYFLWDLYVSVVHVDVFGYAMLAHGISAITVFSLGFVGRLPTYSFLLNFLVNSGGQPTLITCSAMRCSFRHFWKGEQRTLQVLRAHV